MAKQQADNYKGSGLSKGAYLKGGAKNVYSASNMKSALTSPVAIPNLNDPFGYKQALQKQYGLADLQKGIGKTQKSYNTLTENASKAIHNIKDTSKNPVALPVQGLQASNYAAQQNEILTPIANELTAQNAQYGMNLDAFKTDLGFYTGQQQAETQKQQFAQTKALEYAKMQAQTNPFGAMGITGTTPTGTGNEDPTSTGVSNTGVQGNSVGGGMQGALPASELVGSNLLKTRGNDGFVDPSSYSQQKQAYLEANPQATQEQFDSQFGTMLSDQSKQMLGIGQTQDPFQSSVNEGADVADPYGISGGQVQQESQMKTEPTKPVDPKYQQFGLLANTNYNHQSPADIFAKKYIDTYIKYGTQPTSYQLGLPRSTAGASAFSIAAERANDLYYQATGSSLPDLNVLKDTKKLVTDNNKVLNKQAILSDTVEKNFNLAIQGEITNDVNKNATKINQILNPIYLALGDPAVNQALVSNGTISQEFANLISVRNAYGTTVADKEMANELVKFGTSVEAQKAVVERLKAEATNIKSALVDQNKELYKVIDPLETEVNNPNRQEKLGIHPVKALQKQSSQVQGGSVITYQGKKYSVDANGDMTPIQ